MARCFCGCGRRVSTTRRPMNTSGGRVSEILTKHVGYRQIWATTVPDELEPFDNFILEGEAMRAALQTIVHGEADPRSFDVRSMRAWVQHGRKTDVLVAQLAETLDAVS